MIACLLTELWLFYCGVWLVLGGKCGCSTVVCGWYWAASGRVSSE